MFMSIQKQPGTLRYKDLKFDMPTGSMSFNDLRLNGYLVFYPGITRDTIINDYKGIHLLSATGQIADVGDNVAFERHMNQVTDLTIRVC